jgi:hypothetical protein
VTVGFAATQVTSPDEPTASALKLDIATLDRYVGHFRIAPTSILTISREGSQLSAQISGQPSFLIYADSQTEFHWQVVPARVTFSGDANGLAATATIHQYGADIAATRIDDAAAAEAQERLTSRVTGQQPQAGAEAALRKTLSALAGGSPNYGDMTEPLQNALKRQEQAMDAFLSKLGPVQTVEFKGVSDAGADKYLVTHQGGKQTQWMIALATDGRISLLAGLPVF